MRGSSQVKLLLAQLVQILLLVLKLKPAGFKVQMLRGHLLGTRLTCQREQTEKLTPSGMTTKRSLR